ncbi:MAG: hypothetical protein ACOX2E_03415 [Syntrophaceticus sp.]|jgi:hypothetical protein
MSMSRLLELLIVAAITAIISSYGLSVVGNIMEDVKEVTSLVTAAEKDTAVILEEIDGILAIQE